MYYFNAVKKFILNQNPYYLQKKLKYFPRSLGRYILKMLFPEYKDIKNNHRENKKSTIRDYALAFLSPSYKKYICQHDKQYTSKLYTPEIKNYEQIKPWWSFDPKKESSEIILMLPRVHPESLSGGPNTALIFAYQLAKCGYKICCVSMSAEICTNTELWNSLKLLLERDDDDIKKFYVTRLDEYPKIGYQDIPMATSWESATYIHVLSEFLEKKFIYFIQDFEALFFPWSEAHARAVQTYSYNFLPVINEKLLAEFYFRFGVGNFLNIEFQKTALIFEPAISRRYFYPVKLSGHKKRLLFYARPNAPRNLYQLGISALASLVQKGILNAATWEIYLMGEKLLPMELGGEMIAQPVPWANFSTYAQIIRETDVALSLMLSPHTSYMPLECAASGVPVVTTCYSIKTPERLHEISPLIFGVNPELNDICQGICDAITFRENLLTSKEFTSDITLPSTWEESFSTLMPQIKHLLIQH